MRVLIIADDLTGALDAAAPLAAPGLRCLVARRPGDVAAALARGPDVLAVATASREGTEAAAEAAVAAAAEAAWGGGRPGTVFKKVDSRLKGHPRAETAALAARAGLSRALVAPAVPAQGRAVLGGRLTGAGVAAPIDVAAAFAGCGLALDIPDAAGPEDLDAALAGALARGPGIPLLVGAAGLAGALARRLFPGAEAGRIRRLAGPPLFAIGSHDPITRAQVERLAARGVPVEDAPEGECPPLPPGLGSGARVLRIAAVPGRTFAPHAAGRRFAAGVARRVRTGGFGVLLACGGETADAILGEMGAGVLEIAGEVLPGVPVSAILDGAERLQLVTKSGGFGGPDALVSVAEAAAGTLEGAR